MMDAAHDQTVAELDRVKALLSEVPAEDWVGRMSLEKRRGVLEEELAAAPAAPTTRRFRVTFRGDPVIGSEAIYAEFAARATHKLTTAVRSVAAGLRAELAPTGRIPEVEGSRLLLGGTACGSFGFDFLVDDAGPRTLHGTRSEPVDAVDRLREVLEAAMEPDLDEERFSDLVGGVQPRSTRAAADFLRYLEENHALVAMEFLGKTLRVRSGAQLTRGRERLAAANITRTRDEVEVVLLGVLPASRAAEFRWVDEEVPRRASIGPGVADPASWNDRRDEPVRAVVTTTRVGNARPRFVIERLMTDDADATA